MFNLPSNCPIKGLPSSKRLVPTRPCGCPPPRALGDAGRAWGPGALPPLPRGPEAAVAAVGTSRGCARISSRDKGRAVSRPLARGMHSWGAREISPGKTPGSFLRSGCPPPGPRNNPVPSPGTAAATQRNPVTTRLRGSHISFNSNIRVLNIHREIGIGWHLQCFQIHSFEVQRQIKNHSGRKQFSPARAPRPRGSQLPTAIAPARTGATAMPKGDGRFCRRWPKAHRPRTGGMSRGAGFSQEKKEVLSDVKPVTK